MRTPPGKLTNTKYPDWKPLKIIHAILTLKPRKDGDPLDFRVRYPVKDPEGVDIETYAKAVARAGRLHIDTAPNPTQWDVSVDCQCYVLFELEPGIPNWQFRGNALVSKGSDEAYDFGMRWVFADGSDVDTGPVEGDGCRVIYFCVGQRDDYGRQPYNLLVDVVAPKGDRRMPLIFDPDVPNGGIAFP